jgi:endonuclease/exonuclease/phosphatase family metal-dependent hydrolase
MKIKFITINTWFGGKVWLNLIEFINSEKPDILALQEVYDGHDKNLEERLRTMDVFKKMFGDFLPHSAFGATVFDTGVNIPWGNAIFSKFPIMSSRTIFFDLPYSNYNFTEDPDPRFAAEGMLETELDAEGKSLFVYSWHGPWNNHGSDSKERYIMLDKILDALKGKKSIILAGDSNMRDDAKVIHEIEEKLGLTSIFKNRLKSTFNMKHKSIPAYKLESVDKILVSKDIKVLESDMPEVDVSDHYPLKAVLEI